LAEFLISSLDFAGAALFGSMFSNSFFRMPFRIASSCLQEENKFTI
jgi:hypothetical protein